MSKKTKLGGSLDEILNDFETRIAALEAGGSADKDEDADDEEEEDEEEETDDEDTDEEDDADGDDDADDEDEDDEDVEAGEDDAPTAKKAAAKGKAGKPKRITLDDVQDACKEKAGRSNRASVVAILKKKFKVKSVTDLEEEDYAACIAAMKK